MFGFRNAVNEPDGGNAFLNLAQERGFSFFFISFLCVFDCLRFSKTGMLPNALLLSCYLLIQISAWNLVMNRDQLKFITVQHGSPSQLRCLPSLPNGNVHTHYAASRHCGQIKRLKCYYVTFFIHLPIQNQACLSI